MSAAITRRLDAVQYLLEEVGLREDAARGIAQTPDIARAVSRIALQRAGPRDLAAVRDAIRAGRACAALLETFAGAIGLPDDLRAGRSGLAAPSDASLQACSPPLSSMSRRTIAAMAASSARAIDPALDEARALCATTAAR